MGAALCRDPIELCFASGVGQAPLRCQIPAILEAMQRRIERALRDLYDFTRDLLKPLRDRVPMQRTEGDNFQNQKIQRALRKVGFRVRHTLTFDLYRKDVSKVKV